MYIYAHIPRVLLALLSSILSHPLLLNPVNPWFFPKKKGDIVRACASETQVFLFPVFIFFLFFSPVFVFFFQKKATSFGPKLLRPRYPVGRAVKRERRREQACFFFF